MAQGKNKPITVLCDFDGTITFCEVIGEIYSKFASGNCDQLVKLWMRGKISTPEEIQGCFATIHASRQELEAQLDTIGIDASFPAFLNFCQNQGYQFAILSDGLQWYIEYVLNKHGISGLNIYANQIKFTASGFEISFPWYDPEMPKRGTSKPSIIKRYQNSGVFVVFIGDGLSDLEAVQFADRVYAKGRLLEHCRQNELPVTGFSDFADLLMKWEFNGEEINSNNDFNR